MEGETIKKKYTTILDMLKKERLTFGNQLEGLEGTLRKQEDEIEKLKVTLSNVQSGNSDNQCTVQNKVWTNVIGKLGHIAFSFFFLLHCVLISPLFLFLLWSPVNPPAIDRYDILLPFLLLQKTHQAAIVTRDLARQNQHRKEIELLSEGKERERRLVEYR